MPTIQEGIQRGAGTTSEAVLSPRENRNIITEAIQDEHPVPLLIVRFDILTPQNLWVKYSRK